MSPRTYDQYCPVAQALDVVGERWTLLIVRDLMLGPQRYTDLLDRLPGLGPNVLAERLRRLDSAGIVTKRRLPAPAASTVYELTEEGEGLRDVVLSLARWGHRFMDGPAAGDSVDVRWMLMYLRSIANLEAATGINEVYEFRIDGDVFHVIVDDGAVDAVQGPAVDPVVIVESDLKTFVEIGSGRTDPFEAMADGRSAILGDGDAVRRSLEILTFGLAAVVRA